MQRTHEASQNNLVVYRCTCVSAQSAASFWGNIYMELVNCPVQKVYEGVHRHPVRANPDEYLECRARASYVVRTFVGQKKTRG